MIIVSQGVVPIAAALTGAAWAYAWVAAELLLGSIRIYLMMKDVAKAAMRSPNVLVHDRATFKLRAI